MLEFAAQVDIFQRYTFTPFHFQGRPSATSHWEYHSSQSRLTPKRACPRPSIRRMVKDLVARNKNKKSKVSITQRYILTTVEAGPERSSDLSTSPNGHTEPAAKDEGKLHCSELNLRPEISRGGHKYLPTSNTHEMTPKRANITPLPSIEGGDNSPSAYSTREYITQRKRESIERLMAIVEEWVDSRLSQIAHTYGGSSSSQSSNSNVASGSDQSASKKVAGKKRSLQNDDGDDKSAREDGNGEEKRGNKRSKSSNNLSRRFACPFFKHDPGKYLDKGSCTGPGWLTIARLKEHIYRCHMQPEFSCLRCYASYDDAEELESHQRAEVPCKIRSRPFHDGINISQCKQLKKKTASSKPDREKWDEIYLIIFPGTEPIPTPYYEYDEERPVSKENRELDRLLQQEFLPRVCQALVERYDMLEDQIKVDLYNIIHSVSGDLFKEYRTRHQHVPKPFEEFSQMGATFVDDMPQSFDFGEYLAFEDLGSMGTPSSGSISLPGISPSDLLCLDSMPDSAYASASPASYKERMSPRGER